MNDSIRRISSLLRILALVAGLMVLAPSNPGHATDGRDFAGFYDVSNVTDLGDTVRLTLTVRVFNYSDADVNNATVTLQDSTDPTANFGVYPSGVSVRNRESVRLSSDFTIGQQEYDLWQKGGTPSLRIEYLNSAGNAVRRTIELAKDILGEE